MIFLVTFCDGGKINSQGITENFQKIAATLDLYEILEVKSEI